MATDPSYLAFVLEQLNAVLPAINHRPMFGGVGIYSRELFFAIIASDTLYFYVDEANQADYEALGMETFGRHYHQVPVEVLEDAEALRVWAAKSVAAADKKQHPPTLRSTRRPGG